MKKSQNIPIDLIESIRKGECILFLASGLSSQVIRSNGERLPSWTSFLKELLIWAETKRVPFNSDPDEIREMIDKGNLLMAAQELQELINPNEFGDFLNGIFRDKKVKPTESHNLLAQIPFRSILTTNYDTLIEGAYTISSGGQIPKTFTQLDLDAALSPLRKKDFFIFKMHGDIDRPNTIVLGTRSYNNLMYKSPEYLSFLETLFTTHTVLFIGFGGSDPDLDYLMDRLSTIFSRTLNKHFILAPKTKFNFTERRRMLLDKRLEVIEYDPKNNHQEVHTFIEDIHRILNKAKELEAAPEVPQDTLIMMISSSGSADHKISDVITEFISNIDGFEANHWANLNHYLDPTAEDDRIKELLEDEDEDEEGYIGPTIGIILITENALKSIRFDTYVEEMLLKQLEEKIKIIPIVVGNIEVPYKLRNYLLFKIPKKFNESHLEKLIPILKTLSSNK
ncbi:MAG: SIR2 family protein [Crocinitomicaceae bacterium]|nr:SIR2 family protein [Flavobacteriales bacterium]NQZ38325.1 SIR2 family protein [Crocinitomicaceae bacterium]